MTIKIPIKDIRFDIIFYIRERQLWSAKENHHNKKWYYICIPFIGLCTLSIKS